MITRLRRRELASQDGFALMEVIIAAAILILVVLGVLAGLDSVTSTAGANKARTIAATLAEKDQERLRGMKTLDIDKMNLEPYDVVVGKVSYHVESEAAWVYDASGDEVSCGVSKGQASYMRITSTVSSAITGKAVKPVELSSIVAPQVGATAAGSLSVMVKGAAGQPIKDVTVTAPPAPASETTNELGCAVFGQLTAGTYKVTLTKTGFVDKEGVTNPSNDVSVTAGSMSTVEFAYDIGASVTLNVKTKPSGVNEPAKSVVAANSQLGAGIRAFQPPLNAAYATLTDTLSTGAPAYSDKSFLLTGLFPFTDGYTFFSGGCTANDPSKAIPMADYFTTYGGKLILTPGDSGDVLEVYEPTTGIVVKRSSGTVVPTAKVWAYPTNPACQETRIYLGLTDVNGKLLYNGLPFGDYTLCAYQSGATPRRGKATLKVDNLAGVTAPTVTVVGDTMVCGDTSPDGAPNP
jgi:Tfp pilus assembly protein PilV